MTTARDLTQRHRAQQLLLRRATVVQMERLWPALDWARLDATYPAFAVSVAVLVEQNRRTAAGLAASYLRAFRKASGVPGEVKPVFAQPLIVDQFAISLRTTSLAAVKTSAAAGVPEAAAMQNALTQTSGSMARLVLNAGRETVTGTLRNDPRARGYQRVLGGGGCDFCQMLAGRGAVYSADTVGFEAHDHCGCSAEPVYDIADQNAPVEWRPAKDRGNMPPQTDVDASRSVEQMRETLAALEKSLKKFDSPGTRARVEDLRRKIAARS